MVAARVKKHSKHRGPLCESLNEPDSCGLPMRKSGAVGLHWRAVEPLSIRGARVPWGL